jgi:hypothetical protein
MQTRVPPKENKTAPNSGQQRRLAIKTRRLVKQATPLARGIDSQSVAAGQTAPCSPGLLAPNNAHGSTFVLRGCCVDQPFTCIGCGKIDIWRATQQTWWYEVPKGSMNFNAVRCRPCRRKESDRITEARRVSRYRLERTTRCYE